jgi:hypothetical protein
MPTFLPKTLFLTALCCGQIALANDGFYQGGGSSLRPLENIQMRVIEEQLLIQPLPEPVCYHLRFRGRTLDAWNLTPTPRGMCHRSRSHALYAECSAAA